MTHPIARLVRCALALAVSAAAFTGANASPFKPATGPLTVQRVALPTTTLTAEDANAWLDGLVPALLHQGEISGAVVVIVRDGKVITQRGYGYADRARMRPVDPEKTLFRIGSVSKLVTWTAVMQLVGQGKISLDQDINAYLDFKIPPRNGQPVTMRDLLTHSAGFEDNTKYLIVAGDRNRLLEFTLERYLKDWVPGRVFDAGSTTAYSNYGAALAGYIVSRRSKRSFDDYVDRAIFAPLGMARSTFRQPLPTALRSEMAQGYSTAFGEAQPFEMVAASPAGSMSATGADMARFMIAHLSGGASLMTEAAAASMHDIEVRRTRSLPGMALGFYRDDRNGFRVIGHGGDTELFHSDLHLVLDRRVGIFVSANSGSKQEWRSLFFKAFMDRYFPVDQIAAVPSLYRASNAHAMQIAGTYWSTRRPISGPIAFTTTLRQFTITTNADGTLSGLPGVESPDTIKWREIDDYLWQEVGGDRRFAAVLKGNDVTGIQLGWLPPIMIFNRTPGPALAHWQLFPLGFAGLVFLITALGWVASPLLRRAYGGPAVRHARPGLRLATRLVALSGIAALVLLGIFTSMADIVLAPATTRIDTLIIAMQLMFACAALGAFVMLANLITTIRDKASVWSTAKSFFMLFACLGIGWFASSQNLLTMRVNY